MSSKDFRAKTVRQYQVLKHINENFEEGIVELEAVNNHAIMVTDRNGNRILFYCDEERDTIETIEMSKREENRNGKDF